LSSVFLSATRTVLPGIKPSPNPRKSSGGTQAFHFWFIPSLSQVSADSVIAAVVRIVLITFFASYLELFPVPVSSVQCSRTVPVENPWRREKFSLFLELLSRDKSKIPLSLRSTNRNIHLVRWLWVVVDPCNVRYSSMSLLLTCVFLHISPFLAARSCDGTQREE
jgi:hypothetical protein